MTPLAASRSLFASLVAALVLALGACGGDSSLGPGGTANVDGSWAYSASDLTGTLTGGAQVDCDLSEVTLQISQQDTVFNGTASGGTINCTIADSTVTGSADSSLPLGGEVTGSEIRLLFALEDGRRWEHTGTVDGASMSGTVEAEPDFGDGTTLTGTWQATRVQ